MRLNEKRYKRVIIFNINSIVYATIFFILTISTIYFISKSMESADIILQPSGIYTQDQAMAIEAAANNAIGKVNNIIGVSAIFFAIIVSSISVFQFIKIKDLDKINESLLLKSEEIKKELNSSNEEIQYLWEKFHDLDHMRSNLEKRNAKTKVEFNIHKLYYLIGNINIHSIDTNEIVVLIDETVRLGDVYEGVLTKIERVKLYLVKCQYYYIPIERYDYAINLLRRGLEIVKDEDCDSLKVDLYKSLICVTRINGDETGMSKILDEIREDTVLGEIRERILYSDYGEVQNAIEIYNDLEEHFGAVFFDLFLKEYDYGCLNKFKDDKEFINYINDLKIKYSS